MTGRIALALLAVTTFAVPATADEPAGATETPREADQGRAAASEASDGEATGPVADAGPNAAKARDESAPTEAADTADAHPVAEAQGASEVQGAAEAPDAAEVQDAAKPRSAAKAQDDLPEVATEPNLAPPMISLGQCASSDVSAVVSRRRRAVMQVEAPGAKGLGFVFRDKRHVATALSIVDTGRGVRVVFEDGRRVAAEVVAADAARDIAILRLAVEAPVSAIKVAPRGIDVGDPVMALTMSDDMASVDPRAKHRKMRRRRWRLARHQSVVSPGIITSVNGDRLRANALTGRHLSWGAPVLDCKGDLVGISVTPFTDVVISADELAALGKGQSAGYESGWSFYHPTLSATYQFDQAKHDYYGRRDQWVGLTAGAALIGHDRFYFPVRFSATWLVSPKPESQFQDRDAFRLAGSLSAGYRWMLLGGRIPVYLVPQAGANLIYERETLRATDFILPGPCDDGPCQVQPLEYELQVDEWRFLPSVGLGFQVGYGELRYELQLDTDDTGRSIHQFTAGVQF